MATTRIENDAFFTSPWLVDWVIERLPKSNSFNHILEPSGGAGAFIPSLEKMSTKVSAIDINPQHPKVSLGNFLESPLEEGITAVVGNPPFGRNCATGIAFIKRAASIPTVDTIAFILPRTILRNGRCEEAARDFFVWYEHEIPEKDQPFSIETQIKTAWIVFVRKISPAASDPCKRIPSREKQFRVTDFYHPDFRFISASADADTDYDFRIVKTILDRTEPTKLIIFEKGEKLKVSNKRCLLVKCSREKLDSTLETFRDCRLNPEDIFGTFESMMSTTIPAVISAYNRAAAAAASRSRLSASGSIGASRFCDIDL